MIGDALGFGLDKLMSAKGGSECAAVSLNTLKRFTSLKAFTQEIVEDLKALSNTSAKSPRIGH